MEALILENNLIKENKPKYNILLKDDKTYPYIKITTNELYPRVVKTRKILKDNAKYYGPYTHGIVIRENLDLIRELWPLRTCNQKFPRDYFKTRPCLNYHIGKCNAPCNKLISEEEYNEIVSEVIKFLNGNQDSILKEFTEKMNDASKNLNFEKAASYRDKITAIKALSEKQKIDTNSNENQDVIALAKSFNEALVQIFFIRGGKITGREHFILNNVENISREEVITAFVQQFYSETTFIPSDIILETNLIQADIIKTWLSSLKGSNVNIIVPKKGDKLKLVNMVSKNAVIMLEQFGEQMKKELEKQYTALEEIKSKLNINFNLDRIEAYDISNTNGFDSVGSMVVFEKGKPKYSDYRKFKIRSVFGPNDYASIEEVIERRFMRYLKEKEELEETGISKEKFIKLPNMIFIDGGKGQIKSVQNVLKRLNIDVEVCGMVKDDNHRTRALFYNNQEISFKKSSEAFKFITRVQDEVHRFAIEYHKKLRSENLTKSVLDQIEGVGEGRKTSLLKKFGSIDEIRKASLEELENTDKINKKVAESIYKFFKSENL